MIKLPNIEEILAANPHIDPKELAEATDLLRRLRESGLNPSGYRLAPPFSRRHISVGPKEDSRVIRLGKAAKKYYASAALCPTR